MPIRLFYPTNYLQPKSCLRIACGIAMLLLWAADAPQAAAGTVPATFAQFHQANTVAGANEFAYLDNGPVGDSELVSYPAAVVGGAIPVSFSFLTVGGILPADLAGNQDATLTLTSSTISPVVTGFGGAVGQQQILGTGDFKVNTLTITRNLAAAEGNGTRTNLLTMVFTGQLLGAINGSPQLSGDTALLNTVTFSSDFLDFSGTQSAFSLTFSSWTSGLQLSPVPLDQYFQSATAAGAGTFAANARSVPEPSTLTLGVVGLAMLFVGYRRQRRGRTCKT